MRTTERRQAMTIEFTAIDFGRDCNEALGHVAAGGGDNVILLDGRYYVVERSEAERLAAAGVEFAYVHDHQMGDGSWRIVTVPIND